jgi:fluoride exporter
MMKNVMFVFIGGGVGASIRYVLSLLVLSFNFKNYIGTFLANLIGVILIFIISKSIDSFDLIKNSHLELLLKVGLLGGLTTFSTFAYENVNLLYQGFYLEFLAYFLLSLSMIFISGYFLYL